MTAETCRHCGAELPAEARFCSSCGYRTEAEAATREDVVPESETGPVPVSIVEVEPHFFGIPPPLLTLVLAIGALVAAVLLFVAESFVVGALLLSLSLGLFALFLSVVRRATVPRSSRVLDRLSARGTYALASTRAWSQARRELLRRRHELAELSSRRKREQLALGDAAYREDKKEIAERRAAMQETDDRLHELEQEMHEIVARTREGLREDRAAIRPTETITPDPSEVEEDSATTR